MDDLTPPSPFLTVDEAARYLRIGRAAAYELCRRYLATGSDGIPCLRIGRAIRIPRAQLELLASSVGPDPSRVA